VFIHEARFLDRAIHEKERFKIPDDAEQLASSLRLAGLPK
jgi:hypothetical protein